MSNAERARRFKAKQAGEGRTQLNIWVPTHVVAEFKRAAELIVENPHLTIGRLTDAKTGRLRGLE
jgi:hypothetical protein